MIFKNVELHNIEKVYLHEGVQGGLLQRIPENVSDHLTPEAQTQMICPSGAEIRFVSDHYPVKITLTVDAIVDASLNPYTEITVFFGVFQCRERFIVDREPTTLTIHMPMNFQRMAKKISRDAPFSSNVCRLKLWGPAMGPPIRLHDISGEGHIRPPRKDELPQLRYLAYGSSLTQGAFASAPQLSYTNIVGYKVGADVINLGTSCSAYCEKELADYIAHRRDWDFASLALSVNMIDPFTPTSFGKRVEYMINKIAGENIGKPVFCITIKPYYGDYINKEKPEQYRQILRDVVKNSPHPNVYIIEGPELMPDVAGGVTTDFIHLGDYGMLQMGENLTEKIKPILCEYGLLKN